MAYETALAIHQKLADSNPTVTQFQDNLALNHLNIGSLLRASGKPTEAMMSYEAALAIHQKLADSNPNISEFQNGLATQPN